MSLKEHLQASACKKLERFAAWVSEMADNVNDDEPIQTIKDLINEIGYEDWLMKSRPDTRSAERCMENVHELVEWMTNMHKKADKETNFIALEYAHQTNLGD